MSDATTTEGPQVEDDDSDGLDCARGLGAALTIGLGFWAGILVVLWLCS